MKGKLSLVIPILNEDKNIILEELRKAMLNAAEELQFEKAAKIRDEIIEFEKDLENI